jgi:FKBP-type peptidyl-prolyl cis-trans isomerase
LNEQLIRQTQRLAAKAAECDSPNEQLVQAGELGQRVAEAEAALRAARVEMEAKSAEAAAALAASAAASEDSVAALRAEHAEKRVVIDRKAQGLVRGLAVGDRRDLTAGAKAAVRVFAELGAGGGFQSDVFHGVDFRARALSTRRTRTSDAQMSRAQMNRELTESEW